MRETLPPPPPDEAETRVIGPDGRPPRRPPPWERLDRGLALALLVLIALVAAAAAAYFASRGSPGATRTVTAAPATTRATPLPAGTVVVPDVTGVDRTHAGARLGDVGLSARVELRATAKPTGLVVAQAPAPGAHARRGTAVTIVVDRGRGAVTVPSLVGARAADAKGLLKTAGLKAQVTQATSSAPPGTVVDQSPTAGGKLRRGGVVTLSVARRAAATATTATTTQTVTATTTGTTASTTAPAPAPAPASVPDLSGGDVEAASHALADAGLLATVAYVPADEPLGAVVAQSPAAGATAPRRSHVTVNVSSGDVTERETVPDTTGQTLKQAVATLNAAGLRLIFVKVPASTRASVGEVVEQTPAAGGSAPKNAQVLVYVGVTR